MMYPSFFLFLFLFSLLFPPFLFVVGVSPNRIAEYRSLDEVEIEVKYLATNGTDAVPYVYPD